METALDPLETGLREGEDVAKSPRQLIWERFKADRAALLGVLLLALLSLCAIFAGVISRDLIHHGANQLFETQMLNQFGLPNGPNSHFWFGSDSEGRDLLVRVLYGTRTSLFIGVVATGIAFVIGVVVGLLAGYFGGVIDTLISRVADIFLALPLLLIAIGIVAACGTSARGCLHGTLQPGLKLVTIIIALFSWPYIARIVRGNVISIREKEFVEASRALGATNGWIIRREILPNLVAPIIVYATLLIPNNILFEATLSFLGVGVPDQTPSWGGMLRDASGLFDVAWWLMVFPGLFLLATTLAFNLVGDGLRDALDPKTSR